MNQQPNAPATDEPQSGLEKLQRLKARLFPSQTKPERSARALAALQAAKKPSLLDAEALRDIAQHGDLEGF